MDVSLNNYALRLLTFAAHDETSIKSWFIIMSWHFALCLQYTNAPMHIKRVASKSNSWWCTIRLNCICIVVAYLIFTALLLSVIAIILSLQTNSKTQPIFPFFVTVHSPPRIIKQPPTDELLYQVAQQSNENDKPFLIECEAEGEPAPKWVQTIFRFFIRVLWLQFWLHSSPINIYNSQTNFRINTLAKAVKQTQT